jgi:hypothetical protein
MELEQRIEQVRNEPPSTHQYTPEERDKINVGWEQYKAGKLIPLSDVYEELLNIGL